MLSAVGEGRVEFGRKRCRRLDFYVGIVQRLRMYVAFILFYGQAVGKIMETYERINGRGNRGIDYGDGGEEEGGSERA